uniref:Putative secreted protein n=1 Tax=Ixodes ricinus TaxID=34613 RepID=A0A6B0UG92_IXORI
MSVNQVNRAFSTSTYAAVFRFFFAVLEPLALTVAMMLSFNFKIVESELCEMPYLSATVFFFSPFVTSAIIFALMSRARTFLLRGRELIVPGRPHSIHRTIFVVR